MKVFRITKRNLFFSVLFFSFSFLQHSFATTYYLDPSGNDYTGNGSAAKPWKTLYETSWEVKAGDVIHLNPGNYYESKMIQIVPGVTLEGEGIDVSRVIFSSEYGFIFESKPVTNGNQTIRDLTIDGKNKTMGTALMVEGRHNVTVERVKFINVKNIGLDISAYGATKTTPPSSYLKGIKVLNNIFVNCANDMKTHSTAALQIGNLEGAEIAYNTINENIGYGIKFTSMGWYKKTKIHHNNITVPRNDALWGSDMAIELWNVYEDCEVYENVTNNWFSFVHGGKGNGQRSLRVYNNQIIMPVVSGGNLRPAMEVSLSDVEIYGNYIQNFKYGLGIWKNISIQNIKVHHNIMYGVNSEARGIQINPLSGSATFSDIEIYDNTMDVKSSGVSVYANTNPLIKNLKIKNNLIMDAFNGVVTTAGGSGLRVDGMDIRNNNFYQVDNPNKVWKAIISNLNFSTIQNLFTNPQIQSSGNRFDNFYSLKSGSQLIDAGTNVGFEYSGSAPDIGSLEFGEISTVDSEPPATGDQIAKITLIDAVTEKPISQYDPIPNGAEIDLGSLPNQELNFLVTTNPGTVGSVVLKLSGAKSHNATENMKPYSLFGDGGSDGKFNNWKPALGNYTLSATPYSSSGGKGNAGTTKTISFSIKNSGGGSTAPPNNNDIQSLTLIDAVTEKPIPQFDPIPNGAVINLATLANQEFNIKVNTKSGFDGSVKMVLSGKEYKNVTESYAPYCLFGDNGGDYFNWAPKPGNYSLKSTPYSQKSGKGEAGLATTINFSIVNSNARTASASSASFPTKSNFEPAAKSIATKPVVPRDENLKWLSENMDEDCQLVIFNRLGQVLHRVSSVYDVKETIRQLLPEREYYYAVQCSNSLKQSGGLIKLP